MTPFARLLSSLIFTPSRNAKLRLLARYFDAAPDPDRGWALAALSGALSLRTAQPSVFRALVEDRVDPELFRLSYDYVGDLAETVSLIWPQSAGAAAEARETPRLSDVVSALAAASRAQIPALLAELLDRSPVDERFALVKLATGGLRVGVSARLAKTALSQFAAERGVDAPIEAIEEIWHGLEPPYAALFAWLSGHAPAPDVDLTLAFRPMMLAQPLDAGLYAADELRENAESDAETRARLEARLPVADFAAEWKWDGIRVQAMARGLERRLYTRTGDEISASFPDVAAALGFDGVIDGELLVMRDGAAAPFSDLQKRLGRKSVSAALLRSHPGAIIAYDVLQEGDEDLRGEPFCERRRRLERFLEGGMLDRLSVSPLIAFDSWAALAELRAGARDAAQEGVMLKRWDSVYQGGRPLGPWFKWKRDPLSADCVLVYAQRGHGKRSSYYSDFTFAAWRDGAEGPELTPVGKAYSGYTDEELARLDAWIRANTTDRFGPVRAVKPEIVFEVAFDSVQRSTRHKSGVAMRFPRIKRIRWDKPAAEADRLETLERMIAPMTASGITRGPGAARGADEE